MTRQIRHQPSATTRKHNLLGGRPRRLAGFVGLSLLILGACGNPDNTASQSDGLASTSMSVAIDPSSGNDLGSGGALGATQVAPPPSTGESDIDANRVTGDGSATPAESQTTTATSNVNAPTTAAAKPTTAKPTTAGSSTAESSAVQSSAVQSTGVDTSTPPTTFKPSVVDCPACGDTPPFSDTEQQDPASYPGNASAVGFTTPSGNINCAFADDGASVACQISEFSYDVPADINCHGGGQEGAAIELGESGAEFLCAGDFFTGGPVLAYEQSLVVGNFGCASREIGVQCINLQTGAAFILKRDFYQFS